MRIGNAVAACMWLRRYGARQQERRKDVQGSRAAIGDRPAPNRTLLLSANSSWNIAHFRSGLVRGLVDHGYRVVVAAPDDGYGDRVVRLGAEFLPLPVNSSGTSIHEDAKLFLRFRTIIRKLEPYAFLGFTAKPNVYGSLAAQLSGVKVINNITGLGTVFIKRSMLTVVVAGLYRLALRNSSTVLFQNSEDLKFFVAKGIIPRSKADRVPGDGVDLDRFKPSRSARRPGPFRFLLIGRLLWDKGVGEFVAAARIVRGTHPNVAFQLLGPVGVDNKTAIPAETLAQWIEEGVIEYLGQSEDVRPALRLADCVVLPSYREGLPRTLLEGSAMGKPLIATDVPGCRDVVIDGETGLLCDARSAEALAEAMKRMLKLPPQQRSEMGRRGRAHIEANYGEGLVVAKYLEALGRP